MPRFSLGDVALEVQDRGKGPPLLLVHGFPLDHSMWAGQIEAFSSRFRVIAPDLRGFGASGVTTGTVTMEQFADDLAALLAALGAREPVTLCGLSMGGYIAWQFFLRHRARLARLILCDTRAAADTPQAAAGRHEMAERVLAGGAQVVAESMIPRLFAPASLKRKAPFVEATRQVMLRTAPEGIAAALRGMAQRPDMTGRLAAIDVPALLICGAHDAITPPEEMRQMAAAMPHAQFVEIPEAGHMAPLEAPEAVNAAIARFLGA